MERLNHGTTGVQPTLKVVKDGKVAEVLLGEANKSLLVVGSRGITRVAWALLGSAAHRVAARSQGPVLVIRDKHADPQGLLERLVRR